MPTDNKPRTRTGGAADRLRQMYADQIAAADAAEKAWAERTAALAAVDTADGKLRDAVATLADQGLDAGQIATLANVPVKAIRSARRTERTPTRRRAEPTPQDDEEPWSATASAADHVHQAAAVPAFTEGHGEQVPA